ncbi:MAG: hypothetical protein Q9222_002371 [Ikaeria aurantiellina]
MSNCPVVQSREVFLAVPPLTFLYELSQNFMKPASSHIRLTSSTSSTSFHSCPNPPTRLPCLELSRSESFSSVETWLDDTVQEPFAASVHRHFKPAKHKLSNQDENLIQAPLKRQNLRRHLASMASEGSTKQQHPKDSTDTTSDAKTKSSTTSPVMVREMAKQHRIHRNHSNWDLYPDFQKKVRRPYDEAPQYNVRPKSEEIFDELFDYYGDGNEATFKAKVLGAIVKDEFSVEVAPPDADPDHHRMDTEDGPAASGWSEAGGSGSDIDHLFASCTPMLQGVVVKYSARLRQNYLPHTYTGAEYKKAGAKAIQKLLQEQGMTTPEPDAIWGFMPKKMPQGLLMKKTYELMTLCTNMHFPFFTCQCKLDSDYDESLNQNSRDGAAINNTILQILRHAGRQVDKPGPTANVYSYSLTFNRRVAQFWVHWTEIDAAGQRLFHMNSIAPMKALEGPHLLGWFRSKAQAIVEWGLKTRMPEVTAYYDAIYRADYQAQKKAIMGSKSDKGESG